MRRRFLSRTRVDTQVSSLYRWYRSVGSLTLPRKVLLCMLDDCGVEGNLYYNSPYLCRCSQTAGRNSCSIDSGDVSKLFVSSDSTSYHEFESRFGLAFFLSAKNIFKLSRMWLLNGPAALVTMPSRLNGQRRLSRSNNCGLR